MAKKGLTKLPGISARAYEHPADRATLATLRRVPGFDVALRKIVSFVGERSFRLLYLGSAVRVNEHQLTHINKIYEECIAILDLEERPELFVAQTPVVNAGAIGVESPFIVLNSGTVSLFNDDELRFVLGHELGHILSKHVLYKTMLALLVNLSISRFGIPLAPLAIMGIVGALREWDRKGEMSCDRAGLLCVQNPNVAFRAHMKTAGGEHAKDMNVDEFLRQAEDYESGGDIMDGALKLLNLMGRSHPFTVMRTADLKKWIDSGAYQKILDGDYPLRAEDSDSSLYEDVAKGAKSYQNDYNQSQDPLVKFVQDISEAGVTLLEKAKAVFGPNDTPPAKDNDRPTLAKEADRDERSSTSQK